MSLSFFPDRNVNMYMDADRLDQVADQSTGSFSGDSLIQVGTSFADSELATAINVAASDAGIDIASPEFVQVRNDAIAAIVQSGAQALTYQAVIALIEDIEHQYNNDNPYTDDIGFDDFNFDTGGNGVIGDDAGEYGFGMSAGLRLPDTGDSPDILQERLNQAWASFGDGMPAPQIEIRDGLILVDGRVANGASDLLPPRLQEIITDGALAFGGRDGFGGRGEDVRNLNTQFGLQMTDTANEGAGFVEFFQSTGSTNMEVIGGDGTLLLNESAVRANKSAFAEYVAQLVIFGGYEFEQDGTMSHAEHGNIINQTDMSSKLPMYLSLEKENEAYTGYGFSTIFDNPFGTTLGIGI